MTDQPPPPVLEPLPAAEPRVRSRTRTASAPYTSTSGRRREIWISLPCGLVNEIDDAAAAMDRSRARTIEQLLRLGLEAHRQHREAAAR